MKRPRGLMLIAMIQIVSGTFFLAYALLIYFKAAPQAMLAVPAAGYRDEPPAAAGMLAAAVLYAAAGTGLWRGRPWGLRLAVFGGIYSVLAHAGHLLSSGADSAASPLQALAVQSRDVVMIGVSLILLLYLFRQKAFDFCALEAAAKAKLALTAAAAASLLVAAGSLIGPDELAPGVREAITPVDVAAAGAPALPSAAAVAERTGQAAQEKPTEAEEAQEVVREWVSCLNAKSDDYRPCLKPLDLVSLSYGKMEAETYALFKEEITYRAENVHPAASDDRSVKLAMKLQASVDGLSKQAELVLQKTGGVWKIADITIAP